MSYTVLGAKGFIGSRLAAALKNSYAPVRGDEEEVFKRPLGTVFYCIGLTGDYKERPFDTVEAHISYLNRVLEKGNFGQIIYLSSTRLYDGSGTTKEESDLVLNPENPRHLYDLSKALGENMCLTASGGKGCVARLSSVYDDAPEATGFLPILLRRLKRERRFTLDSKSGIVRDYVHVDDVVHGLIKLSETKTSGIVNIASGENVSNQNIADTLNAAGFDITLQHQSKRENPPVCDITKLNAIGIKPVLVRSYLQNFVGQHAAR
jgi:nucleoside-diphosphate-sugar epimerase